ncbi:MAG: dTDP-4-dehydrorhamnose reductase [Candidatus Tectomicrobia bacterium]|nr:dTDP-4-dehydrorhamnose reductase [Candidatus Tectomicrobia bacterium]
MKVAVIGSNGQLGSDLIKVLGNKCIPLPHTEIEVTDFEQSKAMLTQHQPDVIINCAAYHRVDECENNVEKPFAVNVYGVRNVALIAREIGATLLHFSTDYVFSGTQRTPYKETDPTNPINVYGISKLAGEYFVRYLLEKHFVIRSSGLYGVAGSSKKGGNFVEIMLRFAREGREIKVVGDQVLTPTYTEELAKKVKELIQTKEYGLYHITNNGQCSWFEFAKAIFELSELSPNLSETTTAAFGAAATRPPYSVLENAHLKQVGLDDMRVWREALKEYLEERKRVRN